MLQILLIATGGAAGAILRFYTGRISGKLGNKVRFITGTAIANCIGCLLAGVMLGFIAITGAEDSNTILFLSTGFLGSYTTFSTFALEASQMMKRPDKKLVIYLSIQVLAAFGLLAAGYYAVELIAGVNI